MERRYREKREGEKGDIEKREGENEDIERRERKRMEI